MPFQNHFGICLQLRIRQRLTRRFSWTSKKQSYDDTIPNLKIGSQTRVIYQGFTGRQATANASQSIEYGTRIVGGVTPGKDGLHLGLPVLPSLRAAKQLLNPDATAVFVAAQHAVTAIEEAIDAEIPLIVAVAEHMPVHDVMRLHSILKTQSKSRLVGANSPGIISAIGRCRVGFQPLSCFSPGKIGIIAKSGTLSYEAVASTTRAGLGQSLCIGVGGDILVGTNFVEALKVLEHDDDTEGIIIIGEIGGRAEQDAAEWIKDYRIRSKSPKPIMALIGGLQASSGRVMGHAGAFVGPGEDDALAKIKALRDVGVTMVSHPEKFGHGMRTLLATSRHTNVQSQGKINQMRGVHTWHKTRPKTVQSATHLQPSFLNSRSLHIKEEKAVSLFREAGFRTKSPPPSEFSGQEYSINISIDRSERCPCVMVSRSSLSSRDNRIMKQYPFSYGTGCTDDQIESIHTYLELPSPSTSKVFLKEYLEKLITLFVDREAFMVSTRVVPDPDGSLQITDATLQFDDAAFKSAGRQQDTHRLRDTSTEIPEEVEAEEDGIVYIKLAGNGNIGTLVNGAGLAMNTNDALVLAGGMSANFLDTGGKATSQTVKRSFEIILKDPRVTAILVNIFGGITLCDMIGEGIVLAFRDLNMKIPVVVRLRGTNEEIGQELISNSGLPLYAFDKFEPAAKMVIKLANTGKI